MNPALLFTRIFFVILSVFFLTLYMVFSPEGTVERNAPLGVVMGLALGAALIGFDLLFKRFNLRSFNIAIIGLFIGYLMGQALVLVLDAILDISIDSFHLNQKLAEVIEISLFLFGLYLGTLMTLRASDELYVSIPFIKFTPIAHKKKDLLLDGSLLSDSRILDFASSGLLNNHLIIPQFLIKELHATSEVGDEMSRLKAKRALEVVRKLEGLPDLALRYNDNDFPEVKDTSGKTVRLARLLDANILTAEMNRLQSSSLEGIKVISIHTLSSALKPTMQAGENIKIKIQRYGKEPRQGVGYLDDGTMVVVNGGGDYIGEVIEAQVLSVKHTSSGRMIFCNALDEAGHYPQDDEDDNQ